MRVGNAISVNVSVVSLLSECANRDFILVSASDETV